MDDTCIKGSLLVKEQTGIQNLKQVKSKRKKQRESMTPEMLEHIKKICSEHVHLCRLRK